MPKTGVFIDAMITVWYIQLIKTEFLPFKNCVSGLIVMARKKKQEIILTWELTCRRCKSNFTVPVPSGPAEEKELKCPKCRSQQIERIEASAQGAPACSG